MGRDCDDRNCDAGPDVVSAWEGIDRLDTFNENHDTSIRALTTEIIAPLPLQTPDPIRDLIRIAEGGNYTPPVWGRRRWYSLRQEMLQGGRFEHGLEAQVDAIRRLGETGKFDAQQYLESLLRYEISTSSWWSSERPRHDDEDHQPQYAYFYSFPHAKESLGASLAFSTQEYYAGRYPSEFRSFIQKHGSTNARLIVGAINRIQEHLREERLAELHRQRESKTPAQRRSLSDVALSTGLKLLFGATDLGYKVYSRYRR